VICITGDGGFAHAWSELETLKRLRLDIPVIVLNNQILAYQKDAEDVLFGEHTDAVDFEPVDHAALSRSCGCEGISVERAEDLPAALDQALALPGPSVLDVITDPEARPPVTFYEGHFH